MSSTLCIYVQQGAYTYSPQRVPTTHVKTASNYTLWNSVYPV